MGNLDESRMFLDWCPWPAEVWEVRSFPVSYIPPPELPLAYRSELPANPTLVEPEKQEYRGKIYAYPIPAPCEVQTPPDGTLGPVRRAPEPTTHMVWVEYDWIPDQRVVLMREHP